MEKQGRSVESVRIALSVRCSAEVYRTVLEDALKGMNTNDTIKLAAKSAAATHCRGALAALSSVLALLGDAEGADKLNGALWLKEVV